MKIIKENDAIWKAIDKGGGQTCDVIGVIRELNDAGYCIVRKDILHKYYDFTEDEVSMKAELDK